MKTIILIACMLFCSVLYAQTSTDSLTIKRTNHKVILLKVAQKDLARKMDSIFYKKGDEVLILERYDKVTNKTYSCKYKVRQRYNTI